MKTAVIVAGGTGGHIFPGLAVAQALRNAGWNVQWAGGFGNARKPSMESTVVPAHGFDFHGINFSGVRGKGLLAIFKLPLKMVWACWQSYSILQRLKPNIVLVFGGYVSFPMGLAAKLLGVRLLVHEQNAIPGLANKYISKIADHVASTFPNVIKNALWVGNPLRTEFLNKPDPNDRAAKRTGPLRVLVIGGSLGAKALNDIVPLALAQIPVFQRPIVTHQSGTAHIDALKVGYAKLNLEATLTPFIQDMSAAMAQADLIICRSGASTVSEIAAIGAAAVFVPFPSAVDDHQTKNAQFLCDTGAAWLCPQKDLSVEKLSELLKNTERKTTIDMGFRAKKFAKTDATEKMVFICEGNYK